MAVELLGHAAELHGFEIEVLQGVVPRRGVVGEVIGDGVDRALQGIQQLLRWFGIGAVVLRLLPVQFAPAAADPLQGLFQYGRRRPAQGL
ncbi:hypothetical protein FQZ97_957880 [compost metagenome]